MTTQIPQMFTKRLIIGTTCYDLGVLKSEQTNWHWYAFLLENDAVLERKKPIVDERQEAMKEAHFLANYHERVREDYPEDFHRGWHEAQTIPNVIPFPVIT